MYDFPFERVSKGSNIVLYGAGTIGKNFLRQIQSKKPAYVNVMYFVDKDEKIGFVYTPIQSFVVKRPEDLVADINNFDYVVVASVEFKNEIYNTLKNYIPSDKIILLEEDSYYSTLTNEENNITYDSDGVRTVHNYNFAFDKKFQSSFKKVREEYNQDCVKLFGTDVESQSFSWPLGLQWRPYNCCWAASHAKNLEGDFVECGVRLSIFSRLIAEYIDFNNIDKKFYLLDTFEGTIKSLLQEGEGNYSYKSSYDIVKSHFDRYPGKFEIIKGMVPDTLDQIKSEKICYLSLDMNSSVAEKSAIEYLWDRIVSGGVIIMDDYAFRGYEQTMKMYDEFAEEKNVKILNLPCGQGLIIKP